jgi:hypothetical protein
MSLAPATTPMVTSSARSPSSTTTAALIERLKSRKKKKDLAAGTRRRTVPLETENPINRSAMAPDKLFHDEAEEFEAANWMEESQQVKRKEHLAKTAATKGSTVRAKAVLDGESSSSEDEDDGCWITAAMSNKSKKKTFAPVSSDCKMTAAKINAKESQVSYSNDSDDSFHSVSSELHTRIVHETGFGPLPPTSPGEIVDDLRQRLVIRSSGERISVKEARSYLDTICAPTVCAEKRAKTLRRLLELDMSEHLALSLLLSSASGLVRGKRVPDVSCHVLKEYSRESSPENRKTAAMALELMARCLVSVSEGTRRCVSSRPGLMRPIFELCDPSASSRYCSVPGALAEELTRDAYAKSASSLLIAAVYESAEPTELAVSSFERQCLGGKSLSLSCLLRRTFAGFYGVAEVQDSSAATPRPLDAVWRQTHPEHLAENITETRENTVGERSLSQKCPQVINFTFFNI